MAKDSFLRQLKRGGAFLVVGGVAFLVDAVVYNVLVFAPGPLFEYPIVAKIIAIAVASVVTYVGNRIWTYRDRRTKATVRQFLIFSALNVAAILLQLGCLGFSRYVLGLSDPVSDNISGTLIGQAVATVFRYVTYGRWVFPDRSTSNSPTAA
ncbi:GtrA family protein [Herbiconiux ginsengi]|uniref:GtrA family protein n=1 Tax=Herbiconiux ginsengi TaxID=381665 RepID=UPI001FE1BE08|nr:GtrA family protein [Herbiconiux ginsengi]